MERDSDEESLRTIELHHFEAVFGADFVLHAIEVVFDRLFGKREMISDFLVSQTLRDQGNELQLATAETHAALAARAGRWLHPRSAGARFGV